MKTVITFRLRKELDADLIELDINEKELAELCRNGLRYMLGIRTKKTVQVIDQPVLPRRRPTYPVKVTQPTVFLGNRGDIHGGV